MICKGMVYKPLQWLGKPADLVGIRRIRIWHEHLRIVGFKIVDPQLEMFKIDQAVLFDPFWVRPSWTSTNRFTPKYAAKKQLCCWERLPHTLNCTCSWGYKTGYNGGVVTPRTYPKLGCDNSYPCHLNWMELHPRSCEDYLHMLHGTSLFLKHSLLDNSRFIPVIPHKAVAEVSE